MAISSSDMAKCEANELEGVWLASSAYDDIEENREDELGKSEKEIRHAIQHNHYDTAHLGLGLLFILGSRMSAWCQFALMVKRLFELQNSHDINCTDEYTVQEIAKKVVNEREGENIGELTGKLTINVQLGSAIVIHAVA